MILSKKLLSILALSLTLFGSAQAFDFGGLKEKANSAISENGGSELLNLGKSLYSAFEGNEMATKYAKSLIGSLQMGNYDKVFKYYDKIKAAKLTPDQITAWNDVKNKLSAFVMEQNFDFEDADLTSLVGKAVEALQGNNTESASNYLSKIKNATKLSKEQSSLLSEVQAHLLPIIQD